jgi:hypothetical protein
MRTRHRASALLSLLLIAALWSGVQAEVSVFFEPDVAMVQPGETIDVSVRADATPETIASFQLYLSFDPTVLELTEAVEGTLYAESEHMTWHVAEEEQPGYWHLFNTVFEFGSYVGTAGELERLTFTALECGHTQLFIDSVELTDVQRVLMSVGSVDHGDVFVVEATGVEESGGAVRLGPVHPNPFRSGTTVPFFAPRAEISASVEIYDVTGRFVRRLPVPDGGGYGELLWDGTDGSGRVVPSGVYFLRLDCGTSAARCRLVKTE